MTFFVNYRAKTSDYIYWLEKTSWTREKAAFILCGYEPTDIDSLSEFSEGEMIDEIKSVLRLIKLSDAKQELPKGKISPENWIIWALTKSLSIPKKLYLVLESRHESKNDSMSKVSTSSAPLKTIERNTLLKLVIGMAVNGYCYKPEESRNTAVSEITSDMELLGLSMDADTVRKWLKEAALLLPRQRKASD